jgi:DNA repair protein RadC
MSLYTLLNFSYFKAYTMTLCETLGPAERPRERLFNQGAQTLTDAELLAIILGSGVRGQHAVAYSRDLLNQYGGLSNLLNARPDRLIQTFGLGQAKVSAIVAIKELCTRASLEQVKVGELMGQPEHVRSFCHHKLAHLQIEHCMALYLNAQNRLITIEEVSRGTLTQTSIYPREIVKSALQHHASALILAHNHPSGSAQPSQADIHLTAQLKKALYMIDVHLHDHLIVSGQNVTSMAEMGHL